MEVGSAPLLDGSRRAQFVDVKSAMRYLDASDSSLQARFEQGLTAGGEPDRKP